MKVTINWLKEFLDTDHLDPELVAHKLTMSGTEVGKVEDIGKSYENIVTGQVIESSPHPNADKLTVCKVDIKDKVLDIVCGASNFKKMDKVVVACVGAVLPNGMKIKKAKLRGAISEGMMCSEKELELSDESAGIMILDNYTKIGVPFISLAGLDDTVIEMEITPNRPDCMSIIGIAREISALTGIKFIGPVKKPQDAINTDKDFKIDIKDPDLCPRYSAKIFRDIPTAQTPLWLKTRLTLCDQRPVSLLVDLTNYVMLETGQPMHAFDKGLLSSEKIIIRTAAEKEKLVMIDGSSKALRGKDLVIAVTSFCAFCKTARSISTLALEIVSFILFGFVFLKRSVKIIAILSICSSLKPLVVKADVPIRIPDVYQGPLVSLGIEFLLTVMKASRRAFSAPLPVRPKLLVTSIRRRWLSVPFVKTLTPKEISLSAKALALLTTLCA